MNRAPQFIQNLFNAHSRIGILPSLSQILPRLRRDGFGGLQKSSLFIKLQNIPGLEVQFPPEFDWNGDLSFTGDGCVHTFKVRRKGKELKAEIVEILHNIVIFILTSLFGFLLIPPRIRGERQ
jgi:hypothetical protein